MRLNKILMVLALLLTALGANATPISGSSLQDGLNAITLDGSFPDVNASQIPVDEKWQVDASGGSVNTLIFEFAAFATDNVFGIYDVLDPTNRLTIFAGGDGAGTIELLVNAGTNDFTANAVTKTFSTRTFGYFLDSTANIGGGLFFSQAANNSDGLDHMVGFAGDGSESLDIFGTGSFAPFAIGEFILAFEDLAGALGAGSDRDFSDMVVLVESVSPVPEPFSLALLGLGLLFLGVMGRKRVV